MLRKTEKEMGRRRGEERERVLDELPSWEQKSSLIRREK